MLVPWRVKSTLSNIHLSEFDSSTNSSMVFSSTFSRLLLVGMTLGIQRSCFFPETSPRSAGGIQDSTSSHLEKGFDLLISGEICTHFTSDIGQMSKNQLISRLKKTSHPCPALLLKEL